MIGNSRPARRRPREPIEARTETGEKSSRFVRNAREQMARNLISVPLAIRKTQLSRFVAVFLLLFLLVFSGKTRRFVRSQLPFAFGCECSAASDCHSINRHVNQSFSFRVSVISGSFGDLGGGRNGSSVPGRCSRS